MKKKSTEPEYILSNLNDQDFDHLSLSAILDLFPCVTWITSRHHSHFDYISPNIKMHFGHPCSEYRINGYPFHLANIHRDDYHRVFDGVQQLWKSTDFDINSQSSGYSQIFDYRVVDPENRICYIREFTSVFRDDIDGYPEQLISYLVNKSVLREVISNEYSIKRLCREIPEEENILEQGKSAMVHFTRRETEILKLISDGKTSRHISEELSISFHTVNTHRQKIIEKTGKRNIGAVISYAMVNGII